VIASAIVGTFGPKSSSTVTITALATSIVTNSDAGLGCSTGAGAGAGLAACGLAGSLLPHPKHAKAARIPAYSHRLLGAILKSSLVIRNQQSEGKKISKPSPREQQTGQRARQLFTDTEGRNCNPTHGSGWMLQVQPTTNAGHTCWESHPR